MEKTISAFSSRTRTFFKLFVCFFFLSLFIFLFIYIYFYFSSAFFFVSRFAPFAAFILRPCSSLHRIFFSPFSFPFNFSLIYLFFHSFHSLILSWTFLAPSRDCISGEIHSLRTSSCEEEGRGPRTRSPRTPMRSNQGDVSSLRENCAARRLSALDNSPDPTPGQKVVQQSRKLIFNWKIMKKCPWIFEKF